MSTKNRATRHRCNSTAPVSTLVKQDYKSITQLEAERRRRDNFVKGSNFAAIAMCAMFALLSLGCVMFGW